MFVVVGHSICTTFDLLSLDVGLPQNLKLVSLQCLGCRRYSKLKWRSQTVFFSFSFSFIVLLMEGCAGVQLLFTKQLPVKQVATVS